MSAVKKEKLIIVSPSGEKVTVGFLSRCTDGFVLGTPKVGEKSPPHLTILKKDGEISSHITHQDNSAKTQWFPPSTTKDISAKIQELIDQKIIFQMTPDQLPEKIIYLTQKLADLYNQFLKTLYHKEETKKYFLHVIDFQKVIEVVPAFIQELKQNPNAYLGICQPQDFLQDDSKIVGITESGLLIIHDENDLVGLRLNVLMGANFMGMPTPFEGKGVFQEVYQSLGVPQYFQQEIIEKRYLENLFNSP